ncbi:hypothetical protein RI138_27900 [Streptomyces sp. C11-1]|uniref:Deoxyxylulose-5-phosphate synthase n=1 Tax=Streptomyces durocortorensis TaxID=2811104 RepID=A0ABY9W2H4_9ACTN|nr:hypothetical protein [Streptomyces durocortorensis]WNF30342.1 hypothetical protein RI138_27900 [Streptomyces durocortorensis]
MCHYAMTRYKLHFACVGCRVSFKRHPAQDREQPCPNCGRALVCAGHDFAPPPRRDTAAWGAVSAVLAAGLRYEGLEVCGCGKEPRFRPRTRAEVRARLAVADRDGVPAAEALARRDASVPEPD